jgi:8-oxo-dGTP pyrophosphatase MutT (NUDIX family)
MFDVCGVIVENEEGEFLLVKGAQGQDNAGEWTFPGGRLDDGDNSPQYCAQLEAKQETGFDVKIGAKIGSYDIIDETLLAKKYVRHDFVGKLIGGKSNWPNREIESGGWFTRDEILSGLADNQVAPFTKQALRDYFTKQGKSLFRIQYQHATAI